MIELSSCVCDWRIKFPFYKITMTEWRDINFYFFRPQGVTTLVMSRPRDTGHLFISRQLCTIRFVYFRLFLCEWIILFFGWECFNSWNFKNWWKSLKPSYSLLQVLLGKHLNHMKIVTVVFQFPSTVTILYFSYRYFSPCMNSKKNSTYSFRKLKKIKRK